MTRRKSARRDGLGPFSARASNDPPRFGGENWPKYDPQKIQKTPTWPILRDLRTEKGPSLALKEAPNTRPARGKTWGPPKREARSANLGLAGRDVANHVFIRSGCVTRLFPTRGKSAR